MSARIAPLPDGMGVASIADKQPRRQKSGSPRATSRKAAVTETATANPAAASRAVSALDESLPAGTLFAATILSATLPVHQAALTELHIRRNRDWTPPESILHLRDKTI